MENGQHMLTIELQFVAWTKPPPKDICS